MVDLLVLSNEIPTKTNNVVVNDLHFGWHITVANHLKHHFVLFIGKSYRFRGAGGPSHGQRVAFVNRFQRRLCIRVLISEHLFLRSYSAEFLQFYSYQGLWRSFPWSAGKRGAVVVIIFTVLPEMQHISNST
jgi:hypothetical protein